jgi:alpha-mannosidase
LRGSETSSGAGSFLAGYDRTLTGGGFPYHAPQPDATTSLLIRSDDPSARIAWLTEAVPASQTGDFVRFLMLADIQVNAGDPRTWTMRINERDAFTIVTPRSQTPREHCWRGPEGSRLGLVHVEIDKYGDLMGCLILSVPRRWTRTGEPLRIEVRGEGAGSRTWFMVYEYAARDRVAFTPTQAVRQSVEPRDGVCGPRQVVRVEIVRYAPPARAEVSIGPERSALDLRFGYNVGYLDVPEVTAATTVAGSVIVTGTASAESTVIHEGEITLSPVARRTVHLLAHSHVDIGYTHLQDEVERMQWAHLEKAIELARRTREYPPAARYRWNTEVMWAVDSYLRQAAPSRKAEDLRGAVREGWIELDALFANELTALCSPAELVELTEAGRRIARECGIPLRSAMITDIPGFTWSLVTVLAQSGVRYFSVGPNRGHRVGHMTEKLGDRPFWWESPSGEERILCWVHAEGYSLFHTRMYAETIENRLDEAAILPCLERLSASGFPYETFVLRYNVGSDNGPPHEAMPEVVRDWNERYLTPRLVISTVSEAFSALEVEAGDRLPVLRGDLTAYWEDGAGSTALETAINRAGAERLRQAEAVYAMTRPEAYPAEEFRDAWRSALLFDEHTWGSWNSISEPDAELTRDQWEAKRSYALKADAGSRRLLQRALRAHISGTGHAGMPDRLPRTLEVINTECRLRSDLVKIACGSDAVRVLDASGAEVPAQPLSSGELAFVARDVPPLGSRLYRLERRSGAHDGEQTAGNAVPFVFSDRGLDSEEFSVRVDPTDGSIRSLRRLPEGTELVDPSAPSGLNAYLYVPGRDPAAAQPAREVTIEPGEKGPVLASLRVTSQAPGCERLTREIMLVAALDHVEWLDTLEKSAVRTPEGVHFAFPLNVPGAALRYDLAFGSCRVEEDQIPGGNRNYITAAYAVDASSDSFGITLACPDAPLVEIGALRADPIVTGWCERLESSSRLYGYVMNNYWETNYRAEQPGTVRLRYLIRPHGRPSLHEIRTFGVAARRPLLVATAGDPPAPALIPCPAGAGLEIVRLHPTATERGRSREMLMILHNAGDRQLRVDWPRPPRRIRLCDLDGRNPQDLDGKLILPPYGVRSVLVE